ncbi:hypothetical protein KKD62_01185 [Patescibacteria group bacterium]|nr:hypothetical protein [Patescibacteria group bacterium]MBU1931425.1 hypothetical protein [Patescibacteria group bacterium]
MNKLKEMLGRSSGSESIINSVAAIQSKSRALGLFDQATNKLGFSPKELWAAQQAINTVYTDYLIPPDLTTYTQHPFIFLVHPRDYIDELRNVSEFFDIPVWAKSPALDIRQGIDFDVICQIFQELKTVGGFHLSNYIFEDRPDNILGSIMSVAMTIPELMRIQETESLLLKRKLLGLVQADILNTAILGARGGATIFGAGEWIGGLTNHGKTLLKGLRRAFPGKRDEFVVVTGHDATVVYMQATIEELIRQVTGCEPAAVLSQEPVLVVGCGSIGASAITSLVHDYSIPKVILQDLDTTSKRSGVNRLAAALREIRSDIELEIVLTERGDSQNQALYRAAKMARIWLLAPAVSHAIVTKLDRIRNDGVIACDDSQPTAISKEVALSVKVAVAWPVGGLAINGMGSLIRHFPTGLLSTNGRDCAAYSCERQAIAASLARQRGIDLSQYSCMVPGKVTYERVVSMRQLFHLLGMQILPEELQSYGQPITSQIAEVRERWHQ